MKKIIMTSLLLVLFSQAQARQNPFIVTHLYTEEIEAQKEGMEVEQRQEEQYIKEYQQKQVDKAVNKLIPVLKEKPKKKTSEKMYSKKEVKKLIKKAQRQSEVKVKRLIEKEFHKETKPDVQQIVYVKPRTDVFEDENINTDDTIMRETILPFFKVIYTNNKITLDTKYTVLRKFSIDDENKIVIDYRAKKSFYTKRLDLNSKNFTKIALGNHKKGRYFRVVLKLNLAPYNYDIKTDEKGLVTISYNKM